jgi:hypothetical protein
MADPHRNLPFAGEPLCFIEPMDVHGDTGAVEKCSATPPGTSVGRMATVALLLGICFVVVVFIVEPLRASTADRRSQAG